MQKTSGALLTEVFVAVASGVRPRQRVTLPAFRQPVQTLTRLGEPFTVARTRWMFGLKRRFVILRDQGRLLPKPGFLAQMSQTAATVHSDQFVGFLECVLAPADVLARSNRTRVAEIPRPEKSRSPPDDS